jgi:hypothetical protein
MSYKFLYMAYMLVPFPSKRFLGKSLKEIILVIQETR